MQTNSTVEITKPLTHSILKVGIRLRSNQEIQQILRPSCPKDSRSKTRPLRADQMHLHPMAGWGLDTSTCHDCINGTVTQNVIQISNPQKHQLSIGWGMANDAQKQALRLAKVKKTKPPAAWWFHHSAMASPTWSNILQTEDEIHPLVAGNKPWLQNVPKPMDLFLTAEIMPHVSHSLLHWVSTVNSTFCLWVLLRSSHPPRSVVASLNVFRTTAVVWGEDMSYFYSYLGKYCLSKVPLRG